MADGKMKQVIAVIGCGPGSQDLLTARATQVAVEADVLVGADRLLALFPESSARRVSVTADIEAALQMVAEAREAGERVAVLVSGDPGLFSLSARVVERFGAHACEVIPGVSSVQLAFARLGLAWSDALILSAHHELPAVDAPAISHANKIAVLGGRDDAMVWIADLVARMVGRVEIHVCENLSLPEEKVYAAAPSELADLSPAGRAVVVLVREGCE